MSWTDKRSRIARLNRVQRQIEAQYGRTPRYTVYRNGRPYRPTARVRRDKQQLQETLLLVSLLIIGWLWYSALA